MLLNSLHATSMLRGCPRVFAFVVGARVYRRAGASLSKGLSRRRVMCALKRLSSSFLPGVDDTGGQADGESPEGHGEDREAEDEPDVHATERGLLVLGPLRLVVLLRLLDSALPALLHRARWHRRRPRRDAVPRRWGHGEGSCGSRDRSGGERGTCSRPHSRHGPRG